MSLNILFNEFNDFNTDLNNSNIIIFSEQNGRKKNTYVIGWNISKENMKEHLKILKRKHGCNGSIKVKNFQGEEYIAMHLQGEWKDEVKLYLENLGINEDEIDVKV
jgi:translation initiation factor 1 (eIF-1/SUI1)